MPILISIQNDREWATFCTKVLGEPSSAATRALPATRRVSPIGAETDGLTQRCFGAHDVAALSRRLEEAEIAFARVNDIEAILRHPHLRRLTIDSPSGPICPALAPARWMGEPDPSFGPLPALGEHTAAVRREFLD